MKKREIKNWCMRLLNEECNRFVCEVNLPDGLDYRELAIQHAIDTVRFYPVFKPLDDEIEDIKYEKEALAIQERISKKIEELPDYTYDETEPYQISFLMYSEVIDSMHRESCFYTTKDEFRRVREDEAIQQRIIDYIDLFEKVCYSSAVDLNFILCFESALESVVFEAETGPVALYNTGVSKYASEILKTYRSILGK